MRALVRFFFSPVAAVFLPASFFSGALEAVAGALEAGFLSAALGGILAICEGLVGNVKCRDLRSQMDLAIVDAWMVAEGSLLMDSRRTVVLGEV